ncbi:MAG: autotransporter-associated beta strand repeat-containing protein, partial [Gemmataceae bacterium]
MFDFQSWLRRLAHRNQTRWTRKSSHYHRRLRLENLEDRSVPANLFVSNTWTLQTDTNNNNILDDGDVLTDGTNTYTIGTDLVFGTVTSGSVTGDLPGGATIQSAINASSSGDTVNVLAGTYTETLTINTANITLSGVGTSTQITGGILVNADDITIQDLKIHEGATILGETAGVYVNNSIDGLTIDGVTFARSGSIDGDGSRGVLTSSAGVSNLTIQNSTFTGWATGIYLNPNNSNVTISNNTFDNNYVHASVDDGSPTFTDNTFKVDTDSYEGIGIGGGTPNITSNTFIRQSGNASFVTSYTSFDVGPVFTNNTFNDDSNNPVATVLARIGTQTVGLFGSIQAALDFSTSVDALILSAGTFTGTTIDRALTITGAGASNTIITGASPALTVSNTVSVSGATLTTSTDDPTILITSTGNLTLRNSTVQESTGFDQTAVLIQSGGQADLGTTISTGGNTFNINGAGSLIVNESTNAISAIGNTWQQDAIPITNNFTIEDEITHALDDAARGLVRWVANNVYVTPSSGSVIRGVNAAASSDTINVTTGTYAETVSLTGMQTLATANGVVTINSLTTVAGQNVTLGTGSALSLGAGSIAGVISGSGSLIKQGSGTLTLSAANTYTGTTTVNAGTLVAANANALSNSAVTVNAATLQIANVNIQNPGAPSILLNNGATLLGTGSARYSASGQPVIASGATVTFATNAATDTLAIGSGYQNAPSSTATPTINISGPGTVALESGSNSFRGNWVVQSGTLRVQASNSFGNTNAASPLTGSTLSLSGGNLLVRSNSGLSFNGGGTVNIPVTVTQNATIRLERTSGGSLIGDFGTLTIGDQSLTIVAADNITGDGIVRFNGLTTFTGNSTFNLRRGISSAFAQLRLVGSQTDGGVGRTLTIDNSNTIDRETIFWLEGPRSFGSTTQLNFTGNQTIRAVLFNPPSGTDQSTLRMANTVGGSGSILDFRSNTPVTYNNNIILDANAELRLSRTASGLSSPTTISGKLTVNGNRTLTLNGAGSNISSNSPYSITLNTIELNGNLTTNVPNNGTGTGTLTISGVVSESGGPRNLIKSGSGVLVLSGANTYTGTTTVDAGTLVAANASALGTTAGNTVVASGATLDVQANIGTEALSSAGSI